MGIEEEQTDHTMNYSIALHQRPLWNNPEYTS